MGTNTLPLVLVQDEATTVIALPKEDAVCAPQLPGETSILSLKLPEALARAPDYDPLYIFVSDRGRSHCLLSFYFSSYFIRRQKPIENKLMVP